MSFADLPVDGTLDATGLNCPEPVMMLHQHIRDLVPGGLLKVIATDPSTRRDITTNWSGNKRRRAPICTGFAKRLIEARHTLGGVGSVVFFHQPRQCGKRVMSGFGDFRAAGGTV